MQDNNFPILCHCGWRGTSKRIVVSCLEKMKTDFGTEPADCVASIGVGIGACCYEVGVGDDNIFICAYCSSCMREMFFSHRREKGMTGRMAAVGVIL